MKRLMTRIYKKKEGRQMASLQLSEFEFNFDDYSPVVGSVSVSGPGTFVPMVFCTGMVTQSVL